jgi:hypothetical protein
VTGIVEPLRTEGDGRSALQPLPSLQSGIWEGVVRAFLMPPASRSPNTCSNCVILRVPVASVVAVVGAAAGAAAVQDRW